MDNYRPKLASGENAQLSFLYLGYKCNFLWPLENRASYFQHLTRTIVVVFTLISYALAVLGHITFIYEHSNNIAEVSESLSTLLMGIQFFIRTALTASRQQKMRQLLHRFFTEIYLKSFREVAWKRQYANNIQVITILTAGYWINMTLKPITLPFEVGAEGGMYSKTKPYVYLMSFNWYDAQDPVNYIITSLYTLWLLISCSILMAADDYFLCTILIHSSCRYKELQYELQEISIATVDDGEKTERNGGEIHKVFHQRLHDIFRRQQRLESFIQEAKEYFTYQIFLCLSFGVLCLCVVTFHLQAIPFGKNYISYASWLCSQIAQFIMIGYFGQKLMNEACFLGTSYYMSQWEKILVYGRNQVNKSLLNDIKFAIMRSERDVVFVGYKMFPLNHRTISYALRSALSYYMFLNTVNDANKKYA